MAVKIPWSLFDYWLGYYLFSLGNPSTCMKQSSQSPEGQDGEGGGKRVRDGGHMYTRGWFMSMYGKNHHDIVK